MQCTIFKQNIATFKAEKQRLAQHAVQRAALQILANMDIDKIMVAPLGEKENAMRKLRRLIERERLKGTAGHWSYDLNRHIALKQALDRIKHGLLPQTLPATIQ
ncbi:hypothetical protein FHS77_000861 [Paenochrobactrum gallinarii]|uniref:Cytoplasmic protein n=1 Tax=Paenochrobactrum gallinarii TaxID=643673 RepID=A0A841LV09_9HYPH|nr:cytoplasmic protein [Paenochrobactrum gallinarii]MBB6260337.1 hypothetical protein [Paenochrobactrum gallinarii]